MIKNEDNQQHIFSKPDRNVVLNISGNIQLSSNQRINNNAVLIPINYGKHLCNANI